jgi:uncharacterized protein
LWDTVSIGGLIIDDGYDTARIIPLADLSDICQRPIFRCRRIENIFEHALGAAKNFAELKATVISECFDTNAGALVALKSIMAYRGGLQLDFPTEADAMEDFVIAAREFETVGTRIERRPLYHYLLLRVFEEAGKRNLPVQLHVGLGDDDALITESNPALFQPALKHPSLQNTTFVLLHCFPYVTEAAMLASLYHNVYFDLSLSVNLISPQASEMIRQALSIAPTTKLLAGSDGHSCPESHWYAALSWKIALQSALNQLIMDGMVSPAQAAEIAGRILHGNAKQIYQLDGLV